MRTTISQASQTGTVVLTRPAFPTFVPRPAVVGKALMLNTLMLAILAIGTGIGLVGALCGNKDAMNGCIPFAVLFAGFLWHGRNLRDRTRGAWVTQATLSILGLWCFPLGTILNGIILYAWFSADVRAWFQSK